MHWHYNQFSLTCMHWQKPLTENLNKPGQLITQNWQELSMTTKGDFSGYAFTYLFHILGIKDISTISKNPQTNITCKFMHQTMAAVLKQNAYHDSSIITRCLASCWWWTIYNNILDDIHNLSSTKSKSGCLWIFPVTCPWTSPSLWNGKPSLAIKKHQWISLFWKAISSASILITLLDNES